MFNKLFCIRLKVFTIISVLWSLSACAPTPKDFALSPDLPFAGFLVSAQVTLRSLDKNTPAKRFPVVWKRITTKQEVKDSIMVKTLLGSNYAKLQRSQDLSVLQWQGKIFEEKNIDVLSKRLFGFVIPIDSLGYWLMAKSNPNYSTRESLYQTGGRIETITQQQWQIDYLEYDEHNQVQQMRLHFPKGQIDIKIKKWQAI